MCPLLLLSCKKNKESEIWIYTSLYKDTLSDLKPLLEKDFPDLKFFFYQAGSEEIAAKVNAEIMAGGSQADIIISSDRFWHEEMAREGYLLAYRPMGHEKIPEMFKNKDGFYQTFSLPVMVLSYNKKVIPADQAPKSFKEMIEPRWFQKFTTGSPLASGTNFTSIAFLLKAYGKDFFKKLQKNGALSEGGNSAVLRRIQNQERPVGWVLLENLLRFQNEPTDFSIVYPEDGVIVHNNVLSLLNKKNPRENVKKVVDWLFTDKGQKVVTRSYMYSPYPEFPAPQGAPDFKNLKTTLFQWSEEFVDHTVKNRETLKEEMTEALF